MARDHYKKCYGLSQDDLYEFYEKYGKKCAFYSPECYGPLCIDHKGRFLRGLLCSKHNTMLGVYENSLHMHPLFKLYIEGKIKEFTPNKTELADCQAKNCNEIGFIKGFCSKHYSLLKRRGYFNGWQDKTFEELLEHFK